jgi:hypothetical protein
MARTIYNKAIWWSAAGFILLGWLAGHGAWAGALPAPNATVAAYLTNGEESGGVGLPPQDGLLDSPGVGVGCAAAVGNGFLSVCGISANPAGPAVAVTVVGGEMNAESELFYYVQIAGPTNTIVPVIVEGNVSTETAGFDTTAILNADANEDVVDPGLPSPSSILLAAEACSNFDRGVTGACIPNVLINNTILVQSNDILDVTLSASASAAFGTSLDIAFAFADPSFEIDPTFPLADEFSINISPGVGNPIPTTPSVPEPNALALLNTALAALGFIRWRCKPCST